MSTRRRILTHPEDLHCVIYHLLVLASYAIAFWIYLNPTRAGINGPWEMAAFVIAAAMMCGWIAGVDIGINFHNHAHRPIFTSKFLSRWFGRLWTFSGGWPSWMWRYAHVVVHHSNLLHPERDWTVPRRRPDGTAENLYLYMFAHWPWRYAKHLWIEFTKVNPGKRNEAIKETLIFLALWSIPFWIDVKMALLLWVFPHWIANVWAMGPGMWVQHEYCVEVTPALPHSHSNDHLSAAFNATTFNIGYHIEHHENPNVHWSELPKLHQEMLPELLATGAHLGTNGYYGAARRSYEIARSFRPDPGPAALTQAPAATAPSAAPETATAAP